MKFIKVIEELGEEAIYFVTSIPEMLVDTMIDILDDMLDYLNK